MRKQWVVCPVCEGEGKTVNPDIDANGLTREDFADDPEFAADYVSGLYDITCRACNGRRVVEEGYVEVLEQHAADRRMAAREDGDFEAYCAASDFRYG